MQRRTLILLVSMLTLLPGIALAKMNYTFIEGGYINTEIDAGPVDVDGDGLGIAGSWGVMDQLHLFAGYTVQEFDFDIDISQLRVGGGFNTELNQTLDFVGSIAFLHASADGGDDESGYELYGGVRSQLGDKFQLDGGLAYADLDDGEFALRGDARYYFTRNFAGGFGLEVGDDVLTWEIGVRWDFQ